jgi:hypothetical protein
LTKNWISPFTSKSSFSCFALQNVISDLKNLLMPQNFVFRIFHQNMTFEAKKIFFRGNPFCIISFQTDILLQTMSPWSTNNFPVLIFCTTKSKWFFEEPYFISFRNRIFGPKYDFCLE